MRERNEELFRQVADQIEREPHLYDQALYRNKTACGTACCIAGWAIAISSYDDMHKFAEWERRASAVRIVKRAGGLLGLDDGERYELFAGSWEPHDGLSVPDALRKIGEGAAIEDVSA